MKEFSNDHERRVEIVETVEDSWMEEYWWPMDT